jgi:acetolactate synthase small subunit
MEKIRLIYRIETEPCLNAAIRIMGIFSRRRITIIEMYCNINQTEDRQRFTIAVMDTEENALKISKRVEREIDIHSVNLFQQIN